MSSDLGTPAKRHKDIYDFISPQKLAGSLSGKVALITGAGRGIGKAMALAFAEAGCDVALLARTQIQLESVADEIRTKFGKRALVLLADVTDERAVRGAVGRAETELGGLDVVVANAGVGQVRPFDMTPVEEWWRTIEVNVKGQMITAHAALGSMRARGNGTVMFIVSSAAVVDFAGTSAYGSSKAAVVRAAGSIQLEVDAEGKDIQLFSLQPGEVRTDMSQGEDVVHPDMNTIVPGMTEGWKAAVNSPLYDNTPQLSAWTSVLLATGAAKELRGRYLDATHDLEDILKQSEIVKQKKMHTLKVDFLGGV